MTAPTKAVVTVVIPAFNEAGSIADCLRRIAMQDYPSDCLEVIVIDGSSTDGTADIARQVLDGHPYRSALVLENPARITPISLNLGLSKATGEVLCRVDARSLLPPNYVSRCVQVLETSPEIVVTGGRQVAVDGETLVANGIARALRNPAVTGLAAYRRRKRSGPSDTSYLGAFRTQQLHEAGGWDERLATNQDYELNRRMAATGVIWFDADLDVGYIPRRSLTSLAQQYRRFGRWKAAAWLSRAVPPSPRQLLLLAFPPVGVIFLVWSARRSRIFSVLGCCLAVVAVDASAQERSPLKVRASAVVACAVIVSSWWSGVVEQLLRFARGERLLERARYGAS